MRRTYRSYGKINLHLEVLGRRSDGYHELRTIFQTVSLHDEIDVWPAESAVTLTVEGLDTPAGEDNLVHRAAKAYLRSWGRGGVTLALRKTIPVGGGLGGGSSNAATVLLALRDLHGEPDDIEELVPLAAQLGADVPFFLFGGTAVGTDRGDRIRVAPDLTEEDVWILSPSLQVATGEVFARHRVEPQRRETAVVRDLLQGRLHRPSDAVGHNDLEATVLALFPAVKQVYTALVQSGAERVQISGSGGSMFAFFASPPDDDVLAASLPEGSRIFRGRTVSRQTMEKRRLVDSRGEG